MESMTDEVGWFVGIDWATEQHRACLLDAEGKRVAEHDVRHDGAGLQELCGWLLEMTGARAQEIAVAIEAPRGPVVEALLERGFQLPSSSTASAIASACRAPRTTAVTPRCWGIRCAPIGTPFVAW
jgi:hypothetical protein